MNLTNPYGILIIDRVNHQTRLENVSFTRAQELLNNDVQVNGPCICAAFHPYTVPMEVSA
jgi:hypothetical protein